MANIHERLRAGKAVLDRIDHLRSAHQDPGIGSAIEYNILIRELVDLEIVDAIQTADEIVAAIRANLPRAA